MVGCHARCGANYCVITNLYWMFYLQLALANEGISATVTTMLQSKKSIAVTALSQVLER